MTNNPTPQLRPGEARCCRCQRVVPQGEAAYKGDGLWFCNDTTTCERNGG